MADLSNGTTIGGFRQLHENLQKPTLFDKLVIEKHGPYNVWKYADIGDNNVSLELGLRDGSGSGSIRLNSYYANEFCFIRPSDGNLHIDSSNGRYYFNWDPTSNGGANGSIYLGTASGTNGVALNAVGTSYFYGGGLSISGNTSITGTLNVSSTITGSLSGNASTQTKLQTARTISLAGDVTGSTTFDGSQNVSITATVANDSHTHDTRYYTESEADSRFVNASGDTMTGTLTVPTLQINDGYTKLLKGRGNSVKVQTNSGYIEIGPQNTGWQHFTTDRPKFWFSKTVQVNGNIESYGGTRTITGFKVYGAVYNDYAEYRSSTEPIDFGFVQIEDEKGNVIKCNKDRSKKIQGVSSDTLGFQIGKQKDTDTPIAVAGRVLVYQIDKHKLRIGDQVCSTKEGKVRKMKWWEKIFFPEQIVGYVSEFPNYDVWGSDNIKVNGRIWIRI